MSLKDSRKITKEDLEAKLREIHGEVNKAVDVARPALSAVAVAVGVAVVAISFVIGMKMGRKKNTVIEIKRI
ncbi:MAG: hypothetical protein EPN30_05445 [Actinomycetota bacterium]|nr:MAG: hypothetical protein EPN30_05445 [Actinomycetota bacterium]